MQLATWSKRTSTRAIPKSGEHCARETKSRHAVSVTADCEMQFISFRSSNDYPRPFGIQLCSVQAGRSLSQGLQ
jgi:hypothetical protein